MASVTTVFPSMERDVSNIVGRSAAMDAVATTLAQLARAKAGQHHGPTGKYESSIKVLKAGGGKDRLVVNDDPLAMPKEFGHIVIRNGRQVGYARGLHAMGNAYTAMPRVS